MSFEKTENREILSIFCSIPGSYLQFLFIENVLMHYLHNSAINNFKWKLNRNFFFD